MTTRLVLDCDTGTDDAVAIMLAALHPDLELEAVTTVNGNVEVGYCTDNSLRVLDYIGRSSVPVYEGAASPLARQDFPVPRALLPSHLNNPAYAKSLDLPPATSAPREEAAAAFLVSHFRQARQAGRETVLVAVGPLTNIALAVKLDASFASCVPHLVIMGGGLAVANETPSAEFNIWADPEAARVVLTSGIESIVLIPLDATHKALVSAEDCKRFRALGSRAGEAAAMLVENRIAFYEVFQPMERRDAVPVHDALCVAYLLDPSVVSGEAFWVDVETVGELTVGRTVVDTNLRTAREPNVWVATGADERRYVQLLMAAFASGLPDSGARDRPMAGSGHERGTGGRVHDGAGD